ncbi:hypothetical protein V500_07114 [Pseudogymnoascus sp. VKM F-4518 (FW-2643)]|nr:hypothetical protein V500_07114 [Pseudogymnoascus sp. VKM F-4518 (FW-2643)]
MANTTEEIPEVVPHKSFDTILTLDFGSQYTHLITRRLRDLHVYSEMLPCTQKLADLDWKPAGIILSGGPSSVYEEGAPHVDPAYFDLNVPILGICYGLQEIAYRSCKDNVIAGTTREFGHADLKARKVDGHVDRLFDGLENEFKVWMSHGDKLAKLPEGFHTIATTPNSEYAAICHESKHIYGLQLHPEVTHTENGTKILENFAVKICGAKQNWTMANFVDQEVIRIRKFVGDGQVLGAVSGGVDSTVAAKLMQRAIGDRFHAVLVNNGVMRLNECEQVKTMLSEHMGINLTVADASKAFLDGLKGVTDPEKKRKFIGGKFIEVFEEEAQKIEAAAAKTDRAGPVEFFLQGTLYPDVIESISFKGPSATIKTHHNLALPQRMLDGQGLKLIEPLRELFKDEVRDLGRQLGIPHDLVMRHPFPGPGLAIRILGEVTPERVEMVRQADHIFIGMIREWGLYDKISQAFAALDTSKAVGVMGDQRAYEHLIILRAVETTDFMTAKAYPFSHDFLNQVATKIVNNVKMDLEAIEVSRERAVSSEPCSTRPKPFDDSEYSARKRQRVSSGSRSRSADTGKASSTYVTTPREHSPSIEARFTQPQTPSRTQANKPIPEPTSSKVTINLRSNKAVDLTSSPSFSPTTPSKMSGTDQIPRLDIELDSDGVAAPPETISSSSSTLGSPKVELIMEDDDIEYGQSPPVAVIDDDDDELLFDCDPVLDFPYASGNEAVMVTVRKIAHFFEHDAVDGDDMFCRLRDWMASYLQITKDSEVSWSFFGSFLQKSRDSRLAVSEFFMQFAELTARFVAMDVRTLAKYEELDDQTSQPMLASRPYLLAFGWLLQKRDFNIGHNLEQHYRFDWGDEVSSMVRHFIDGVGSIPALTRFVRGHLAIISKYPKGIEDLTEPSRIVDLAISSSLSYYNNSGPAYRSPMENTELLIKQGYQFFKVLAPALDTIIEKHATMLTAEAALVHIIGLSRIYLAALNLENSPVEESIQNQLQSHPTMPPKYNGIVISAEWKFSMLKKIIVCGQMQLRVCGVTTMCTELLSLYTKHKKEDSSRQPILIHFAEYIMANKLVDYIVGTGSHPELISESGNIVGFLMATKSYTNKETDTIWQTVTTSQDPRVVEAVLRMLASVLNLLDYDKLLYLCDKASALPIEAFTTAMRDHCQRVIGLLIEKATGDDKTEYLDAPPYELCIRLIRESSMPRSDAPLGLLDVQHWATNRLRELVRHGPEAEIRNKIYLASIQDIASRSPTASGSICALYGLLSQNLATDLRILTAERDLTKIMIEEVEYTNRPQEPNSVPPNFNSPARQARRDLLLAIILNEPRSITPDLGERLWTAFVGQGAQSPADREIAWQILNSAAAKVSSRNVFIATCFEKYLPKLEPQCYTIGSLDFTREAIQAWLRGLQGDLLDEDTASGSRGLEHLWRMILTAPPNSIEDPAINMLVELYVDSPMIQSMARPRAHTVHLRLVNRCLEQMSYAAGKLKGSNNVGVSVDYEPMAITAPEQYVGEEELIFTRSLVLLREFLRAYQLKPYFAVSKPRPTEPGPSTEVKGEVLDFKYQIFDGQEHGPVSGLEVGKSNTVAELFAIVEMATKFKNFKLYHWGAEISDNASTHGATLEDLQIGKGLVLVTRQDDDQPRGGSPKSRTTSLEVEVINHFDAFWDYLGMEERLSKEIYHFLVKFPVYPKLLAAFEDDTTAWAEIFPLGQPFKCLYAVFALRETLEARMREGKPDSRLLSRSLGLIVSAITNQEVLDSCANEDLRSLLAQALVECLMQLLREPIPVETVTNCLTTTLLECLLQILESARLSKIAKNSIQMVSSAFEAILEASLHSRPFWTSFITAPSTPQLIHKLLLEDHRSSLRKSIMKQMTSKCSFTPSLSALSTLDVTTAFWPLLRDMIPSAVSLPDQCEEALSVALLVFRNLAESSVVSVDLDVCLFQWGTLLTQHTAQETVGSTDEIDVIARGLSNLLYWCTSFAKASEHPIPPNQLGIQLFNKHLFPPLSDMEDDDILPENIPVLNSTTRRYLADAIVNLTRDDVEQYKEIMSQMESLAPYDPQDDNDSSPLSESSGNQKLLSETQKLFGFMQNSFKRFIDPTSLALSIRTYDDTNIDVNIQMDVDEFYNLLIDRWESQISSPEDKLLFRSFYGGQLVHQVKSKECPHISESLEPFSAIQCDIKGKSSLQESLQAYVDGEVMEGDNKYKCSTCDRDVNAVKRACLQDVPDNLIFHLKRFDFNLRTMQRSKINDYFSFPHKIDMRPYKVEHLMDGEIPSDMFELVGILVHSGTAESGHYYSYIRERPSRGKCAAWVEFNDDHVTSFDPNSIEASCFGGFDYRGPESGSFQFDKSWSAYMLFYQRSSVVEEHQQELMAATNQRTFQLPIPQLFSNFITRENEMLIRKYCLYDESHGQFVLRMMDNDQHFRHGRSPDNHSLSRLALSTTLLHLDQVVARAKDLPDFATYMLTICHRLKSCTDCCEDFLDWLGHHQEAFRQLLMRNPEHMVRSEIALAVVAALNKVKEGATFDYGCGYGSEVEDDVEVIESPRLFPKVVGILLRFWNSFHLSVKAWPEYFGLLIHMVGLGTFETASLLDAGFLLKVLEILTADAALPPHPQYTRMLAIIHKRPITRPVSLENIIGLLEVLLKSCDLAAGRVSERESRLALSEEDVLLPLSTPEYNLLIQHWTRGNVNILTEKLLNYNQNQRSTQEIIRILLENFDDTYGSVLNAIRHGIRKTPSTTSPAPFLAAGVTYCCTVDSLESVEKMIYHVSNVTRGIDNSEGREFLRFFKELLELPPTSLNIDHGAFFRFAADQIQVWAPSLLTYYDSTVRRETEDYLQSVLFRHEAQSPAEVSADAQANTQVITITVRQLGVACLRYLHEKHVRPRTEAVKANIASILAVIESCKPYYDDATENPDEIPFHEYYTSVLSQLKKLTVDELAEDDVSEWDNSDDAFSSSEVLDPVSDICGRSGNEMNDTDV